MSARLVRVGTDGVDRETGEPVTVFYEVEVTGFRQPTITRTFTHEWNARLVYFMAQHGITDLHTPLGEIIGPRLWHEPKNLTALAKLAEQGKRPMLAGLAGWPLRGRAVTQPAPGSRMNSGDSEAELPFEAEPAGQVFADA